MYKVIIDKVNFDGVHGTNFEGEGTTIKAALNRAKKEMNNEYPGGVVGFNYNTYKRNAADEWSSNNTDEWTYLQTFGA